MRTAIQKLLLKSALSALLLGSLFNTAQLLRYLCEMRVVLRASLTRDYEAFPGRWLCDYLVEV